MLWLSERNADASGAEFRFYLGLTARLLLSAVIEGDRRDTAAFMDAMVYTEKPLENLGALPLGKPEKAVPFRKDLWRPFYRTHIIDAGARKLEELPEFCNTVLSESDNLLLICN